MLQQAALKIFAAQVSYKRLLHKPELTSTPELLFVLRFSLFTLAILIGSSFEVAQLNHFHPSMLRIFTIQTIFSTGVTYFGLLKILQHPHK